MLDGAFEAVSREYGLELSPTVVEALYGSVGAFVDELDGGMTRMYEKGREVPLLPSSAVLLRDEVSGEEGRA